MNRKLTIAQLKRIAKTNSFISELILSCSLWSLGSAIVLSLFPYTFLPERNKSYNQLVTPLSLIGIAIALPWAISAENFKAEVLTPTPCHVCKFYCDDRQGRRFLQHPCAVHPQGKPDQICRDWESTNKDSQA